MYIATDLHGHTHFSDGRATPEAYVEFRRSIGMSVIAIADHDVFAGVRRGAAAAHAAAMLFVPAAEITSFFHFGTKDAEQVHVLAYFPTEALESGRLERSWLYRRGVRVQETWRKFVLAWLDGLASEDRDLLGATDLAAIPAVDFPALQSMIDRIVARARHLYDRFRIHHVHFWEDDKELFGWSPDDAIDAIRSDGAIDIVAHPVRYRDKAQTEALLSRASGLEVYTSRHKAEVSAQFRAFAEQRRKLWTSSSDDHQNARYMRPPCGSPVLTIERILRRAVPLSMILAA